MYVLYVINSVPAVEDITSYTTYFGHGIPPPGDLGVFKIPFMCSEVLLKRSPLSPNVGGVHSVKQRQNQSPAVADLRELLKTPP